MSEVTLHLKAEGQRACTDREALALLGDELRDIEDKGARDLLLTHNVCQ